MAQKNRSAASALLLSLSVSFLLLLSGLHLVTAQIYPSVFHFYSLGPQPLCLLIRPFESKGSGQGPAGIYNPMAGNVQRIRVMMQSIAYRPGHPGIARHGRNLRIGRHLPPGDLLYRLVYPPGGRVCYQLPAAVYAGENIVLRHAPIQQEADPMPPVHMISWQDPVFSCGKHDKKPRAAQ